MIPLVEGLPNTIKLKVEASIDIEGYSAVLAACGVLKTIPDLTADPIKIEYTADEVQNTSKNGTYGTLEIYDNEGKLYLSYLPQFYLIPEEEAAQAQGYQAIYITIASTKEAGDGGGGGGDLSEYAKKTDLAAGIAEAEAYTDEQIDNIGEVIIADTPVTVDKPAGGTTTLTVKEAIQKLVNDDSLHTVAHVEDEDHDGQPDGAVLYLNPEPSIRSARLR